MNHELPNIGDTFTGPYAEPMRRLIDIHNKLLELHGELLTHRRSNHYDAIIGARPEDRAAVEICATLWKIGEFTSDLYVAIAGPYIDDEIDSHTHLWG